MGGVEETLGVGVADGSGGVSDGVASAWSVANSLGLGLGLAVCGRGVGLALASGFGLSGGGVGTGGAAGAAAGGFGIHRLLASTVRVGHEVKVRHFLAVLRGQRLEGVLGRFFSGCFGVFVGDEARIGRRSVPSSSRRWSGCTRVATTGRSRSGGGPGKRPARRAGSSTGSA